MSLNLSADLSDDVFILEERPPVGIYIFAAIALGFIGFFGFSLNLLVIVTVVKNANILWTPNNVVLVNMVIGDFLVAALGNPFAMTSAIAGEWFWSHEVCLWYAWFMTTMGFASIGNLTVMAMERFLLVTCPMKTLSISVFSWLHYCSPVQYSDRVLCSHGYGVAQIFMHEVGFCYTERDGVKHAYILAILVWIYALSLSLPPFFNWGTYGPEAGNISCSVSWEMHDPETHNDTYIGFLFIVGFFLPVMIIISSYYGIIKTLRKIRKRVGARNRREKKVTKMVYLMILAFLIAWSPYAILALATQYFYVQTSHIIAVLPALLAKSSICYNPIIYASMTAQFPTFKKMFSINGNNAKNKQQHGSELQIK